MKKSVTFIFAVLLISIFSSYVLSSEVKSSRENKISADMSWDEDEIINGEEFYIRIKAVNLKEEDYDVKVFISIDGKTISQTQNAEEKWITSNNYYKNFLKGPDDASDKIKLRIKKEFSDFEGKADIGVRIRESGASGFKESKDEIEIIKAKTDRENPEEIVKEEQNNEEVTNVDKPLQAPKKILRETIINNEPVVENELEIREVIILNSKKPESTKETKTLIYESKNEMIKKYSIYGFALLCVGIIILLMFRR